MKLYLSVVISILVHLLFLTVLSQTDLSVKETPSVFNVDIVAPFENEQAVKEEPVIIPAPPAPQPAPPVIIKEPLPPVRSIIPDNMTGEGDSISEIESPAETLPLKGSEKGEEGDISAKEITEDGFYLAYESSVFNREMIKKRKGEPDSEGEAITFDTSDLRYRGYMKMLKEQIESIWQYPKEAAELGISGDLRIRFVIKKDGSLGDIRITRPSGFRDLDKAALKAIEDSFPSWPLPDDWEGDEYPIDGHFVYVLGGTYVF